MTRVRRDWYERHGEAQRERNRRYLWRNAQRLWDYLATHPCVECGEADPVVLQFDHVRGTKLDSLSNMSRNQSSLARLDTEIAKCEVRCANCHARKTAVEQEWYAAIDRSSAKGYSRDEPS